MDLAADGTHVIRTDTYGGYIWTGSIWRQLITDTSMPAAEVTVETFHNEGIYEVRIAPSDTNILYMTYLGFIYKSVNKGLTWVKTAFAHVEINVADGARMQGQKMAIDPHNSDVVYVGTQANGLFVTFNGGTTWSAVASIPVSGLNGAGDQPGITGICFDPNSGTTGGRTNVIFASSYGHGVYRSANAGSSWTSLAASGPSDVFFATVAPSGGAYWAVCNGGTTIYKWSGSWTHPTPDPTAEFQAVLVDPFNASHILIVSPSGYLQESTNGGTVWSNWNFAPSYNPTQDVPWLRTVEVYMSIGGAAFDPAVQNKLWVSAGVGVWNTIVPTPFTWNTPVVWNSQSVGIEQLVANDIAVSVGGDPIFAVWDRSCFKETDPDTYRSGYIPPVQAIVAAWSVDFSPFDPTFFVGICNFWGQEHSGYSNDGGTTWHEFPTQPPFAGNTIGGSIAVSSTTNVVWVPANGYQPYYTKNGGTTWSPVNLPGVTDWSLIDFAYYLAKRSVTADTVLADTFYMYVTSATNPGVYKTTNKGDTWTKVKTGNLGNGTAYNSKIAAVPGRAGHLFFTEGSQTPGPFPHAQSFYHSTDGGATWVAVANVKEVWTFGYGKAAAGGYPAVFIIGFVNNVFGTYRSDNEGASWSNIGTWLDGSLDYPKTISGDPDIYGRCYVGYQGSGFKYFDAGNIVTVPPLFTDTDSFFAPSLSRSALLPSLFSDADAIQVPSVKGLNAIAAPLLTDSDSFFSPLAYLGALVIPLFTDSDVQYSPSIVGGVWPTSMPLVSDTDSLYGPTVMINTLFVTAGLLTDSDGLQTPTVGASYTVQSPFGSDVSDSFYNPSGSAGIVVISPPETLEFVDVFQPPAISLRSTAPLFLDSDISYAPVLAVFVGISPALLSDVDGFYSPTLTAGSVASATPFLVDSVEVAYGPSLVTIFSAVDSVLVVGSFGDTELVAIGPLKDSPVALLNLLSDSAVVVTGVLN